VIKKEVDSLTIENPGSIRTGKKQMLRGGISDPRNKTLMKMFNLIGIGERAGSGIPDIYQVWEDEGWAEPKIEERYNPDRTILTLSFAKSDDKKATIKSDDKKATIKSDDKKQSKTSRQQEQILKNMSCGKEYRLQDFCDWLGLKETRTKEILKPLIDEGKIAVTGKNKDRRYKL
jgi:predicted HTH transcriptional regulator